MDQRIIKRIAIVKQYRIIFKYLFVFLFCNLFIAGFAQDFIHKQYVDPIYGKVIDISKKEIRYQKQTYFDTTDYAIKRREVIKIEYEDGTIQPISRSRWDKFYRPTVYLLIGGQPSISDSISSDTEEWGIGHKGIFRLPWKGFGISYTTEFRLGYLYYKDTVWRQNDPHKVFFSASLNVGLEYRYSFFRGFGIYGGVQAGYNIMSFRDQNLVFSSSYPTYTFNIGAHAWRVEFGIKYTRGIMKRRNTPDPGTDLIPKIDRYNLSSFQLYWGFNF